MCVKKVMLKSGMSKCEVDGLLGELNVSLKLIEDSYLGANAKHNWICKCGSIIYNRTWGKIKSRNSVLCDDCRRSIIKDNHKKQVNMVGGYKYINTYFENEILPSNKIAKTTMIEVKHLYCNNVYVIRSTSFLNNNDRCSKCCGSYENSFAHHIEVELGEPLDKYWDFEKNVLSPYNVSKCSAKKVWIKCQNEEINELNGLKKKDYHESYEISCSKFTDGRRCGYCRNQNQVHLYDSFGYNNVDKLLNWIPKNNLSPFEISNYSAKYITLFCYECEHTWTTRAHVVSQQKCWCPLCNESQGERKIRTILNELQCEYILQKEFDGLIGLRGGNLSYDFYLPGYNLLIEYQGEQHRKYKPGFHKSKDDFYTQKEHDIRKKKYSIDNNIELLEIWYYDFPNIEEILKIKL